MNSTEDFNNLTQAQIVKQFEQQGAKLIQEGKWQSYFVMLFVLTKHNIEL